MSWKQRAMIVGVLVAGNGGRAHADTQGPQSVVVPAYWDPGQSDFTVLSTWDGGNSSHGIKSAVVNLGCEVNGGWNGSCLAQTVFPQSNHTPIAGGPGSAADPDFQARLTALAPKITQLQQMG
jgi:hypothetical protein